MAGTYSSPSFRWVSLPEQGPPNQWILAGFTTSRATPSLSCSVTWWSFATWRLLSSPWGGGVGYSAVPHRVVSGIIRAPGDEWILELFPWAWANHQWSSGRVLYVALRPRSNLVISTSRFPATRFAETLAPDCLDLMVGAAGEPSWVQLYGEREGPRRFHSPDPCPQPSLHRWELDSDLWTACASELPMLISTLSVLIFFFSFVYRLRP